MKRFLLINFCTLALLLTMSVGLTEESKKTGVEALTPELRGLLQQEMRAIETAMKDLVSHHAAGDFKTIEQLASQIENSFILQQNLTQDQLHQLHTVLPDDFLQQDQQFHYDAGMLQHVAANKKPELVAFYYGQLLESCGSCHRVHAKHKFPLYDQPEKPSQHGH